MDIANTHMFEKIQDRKSLSQQIEEEISCAIRSGDFPPGRKLPTELEMCGIFNVSRTAVREAIKRLNARGVVEVRKGSGVYVTEISLKNASEVLNMFYELSSDKDLSLETIDARAAIEPALASYAAKMRTLEHIDVLRENIAETTKCPLRDKRAEAELDNQFHATILSISRNRVLGLMLSPLFSLIPKLKLDVYAKPLEGDLKKDKEILLEFHTGILEAIIDQDSSRAEWIMRQHLAETRTNYLKFLERS